MAVALWLSLGLAGAAPLEAQAPTAPSRATSEAAVTEARLLFQAGNAAADAAQFADALVHFTRAFELSGNPAALYNVARTLRALGRHLEARDAFDRLLTEHVVSEATRAEATALRQEEARRISTLTLLDLPGPGVDLALRVDGTGRPDPGGRPLVLELDPGAHGLLVQREHFRPFTWDGVLGEGQREAVRVQLEPEPTGRTLAEEPLVWIVTGVVLLAGGAVAGGLLWEDAQLNPGSTRVIRL